MFDRIVTAFTTSRGALRIVADVTEAVDTTALRAEVVSLFQCDLDDFTRTALDRRARKAARGMALAA